MEINLPEWFPLKSFERVGGKMGEEKDTLNLLKPDVGQSLPSIPAG